MRSEAPAAAEPAPMRARWRKAAVLGSLWASSEILLGSFLHNLQVPLRGHILTAIAVVVVAAGHRVWPDRGLVWRAGLVAAAMKAVSPSAVLLGPMLAIAMEGVAFEAGLAAAGRGLAGCVVGGALAMSWTFAHQLGSLIVTYGTNLVAVYQRLVMLAEEAVGGLPLGEWGPIAALAVLNVTLGAVAGGLGWRVGGRGTVPRSAGDAVSVILPGRRSASRPRPSLLALLLLLAALPAGLVALPRLGLATAFLAVAAALAAGAVRYGAALRRLARPRFWIGVLLVSAAAAVAFRVGAEGAGGIAAGLRVAAAMTLRAAFVTACFAAVGVELSNRRLRAWLARLGAAPLLEAVEVAFGTLPAVVAAMPPARALLRHPGREAAAIVPRLDEWLARIETAAGDTPAVVISGASGSGKTTLAAAAADELGRRGVAVGGIVAPGTWRSGHRWAFEVVDLRSAARSPLCAREGPADWLPEVGFRVNPAGLEFGRRTLEALTADPPDVVVVDEVGPWELRGRGWAAALDAVAATGRPLLLVVRPGCLEAVAARWRLAVRGPFLPGRDDATAVASAVEAAVREGKGRRGGSR